MAMVLGTLGLYPTIQSSFRMQFCSSMTFLAMSVEDLGAQCQWTRFPLGCRPIGHSPQTNKQTNKPESKTPPELDEEEMEAYSGRSSPRPPFSIVGETECALSLGGVRLWLDSLLLELSLSPGGPHSSSSSSSTPEVSVRVYVRTGVGQHSGASVCDVCGVCVGVWCVCVGVRGELTVFREIPDGGDRQRVCVLFLRLHSRGHVSNRTELRWNIPYHAVGKAHAIKELSPSVMQAPLAKQGNATPCGCVCACARAPTSRHRRCLTVKRLWTRPLGWWNGSGGRGSSGSG